jgi:hypothetical protein
LLSFSECALEPLSKDDEFILCRGRHRNQAETTSVLLLLPALTRSALETLKKIKNEYSLRNELNETWAVRPLAVSHFQNGDAE